MLNIHLPEQAKVLSYQPQAGGYTLLRLLAPQCAAHAQPGTLVRLTHGALMHTAPLLRADARTGQIDILLSATSALPVINSGEFITLHIAPNAALALPSRPCPLIIGDTAGTAPTVFMAERLRQNKNIQPLVLLGYDTAPPFIAVPSRILVQGIPHGVIAAMPLLEDWGIPSRIAHTQGRPGCFEGTTEELTRLWLDTLSTAQRAETEIIVSGSNALTSAVTALAHHYQMPCQALVLAQ